MNSVEKHLVDRLLSSYIEHIILTFFALFMFFADARGGGGDEGLEKRVGVIR